MYVNELCVKELEGIFNNEKALAGGASSWHCENGEVSMIGLISSVRNAVVSLAGTCYININLFLLHSKHLR